MASEDERQGSQSPDESKDIPLMQIFPSKFGLPSFDPDSLAVLAYSMFGKAKLTVQAGKFSRFGVLCDEEPIPSLNSDKDKLASSVEEIIDSLRELRFGTDFHLSQKECADAVAFIELMNSRLRPAVMHTYWLEEGNYAELTRETYATVFSLPATIFYPRWRRLEAVDVLYKSDRGNTDMLQQDDVDKMVYRDAIYCLDYLSDKLGSQPYLFGKTPTTVDAIMFGYLAPLLKMPFPRNRLKEHIESYSNICNTLKHIQRIYFPPAETDDGKRDLTPDLDTEFPHKLRNTYIAAVFGVSVLVTYILLRGVITIQIEDDVDL